jgi:Fe-S-cluster-containing dehydrogenase component
MVQEERCIGCAFCVEACPFGVIRVARRADADGLQSPLAVVKCDLCQKRQAARLEPACVASCPVRALSFEEADQSARRIRALTAALLAADGS